MNEVEQRRLLQIARAAIEGVFQQDPDGWRSIPADGALREPRGAFVTITQRGSLRGCIGSVYASEALHEAVAANAVNAAFHDPRFPALAESDLPEIELEISVLSPIARVADISEIEVGRDGLIIRNGRRAGLLLPQVATEYGWDRNELLRQTCRKAGLPPSAWSQAETTIDRFTAEVFRESQEGH